MKLPPVNAIVPFLYGKTPHLAQVADRWADNDAAVRAYAQKFQCTEGEALTRHGMRITVRIEHRGETKTITNVEYDPSGTRPGTWRHPEDVK